MTGQHLTGWGLPNLRRAIAVQWDRRMSPTIESNPWRHAIKPIERRLMTGICCSLCCFHAKSEAGASSPGLMDVSLDG